MWRVYNQENEEEIERFELFEEANDCLEEEDDGEGNIIIQYWDGIHGWID
jgi:hypothetical protein